MCISSPAAGESATGSYEGTVDFEGVNGELTEVSQRRVAGAEVVDGNAYPYRLQLV